jgi:probable rRNA maturation factor
VAGKLEIDLTLVSPQWREMLPNVEEIVRCAAEHVWASVDVAADGEVSLLMSDDAAIRSLNWHHRGKDQPTNVLAFPMGEPISFGGPIHLGDVVLARETVIREAARDTKTLEAHVSHLTVHGLLHLLGHDHQDVDQAAVMEGIEILVLAELGYSNPYLEGAAAAE